MVEAFFGVRGVVFRNKANARINMICETEIHSGEPIEKTVNFVSSIQNQAGIAVEATYAEIAAANQMINDAEQCSVKKCHPVCSPEPVEPGYDCNCISCNCTKDGCSTCCSTCNSVECNKEKCSGEVCPNQSIDEQGKKIDKIFNIMKDSSDKINKILRERDDIKKSLWKVRGEFNKYHYTVEQREKLLKNNGRIMQVFSCPFAAKNGIPIVKPANCKNILDLLYCH